MYVAKWPSTRRISLLIGISFTSCITLVYYYFTVLPINAIQTIITDTVDDSFFVKTPGCRISRLDPFDSSIRGFLDGFGVNCSRSKKGGPPLLQLLVVPNTNESNSYTAAKDNEYAETEAQTDSVTNSEHKKADSGDNIRLRVLESGFQHYHVSPEDRRAPEPRFYCVWQSFSRKTPDPHKVDRGIDNSVVYGAISQPFTDDTSIPPGVEFIRGICYMNETEIYKDFFFIPSGNAAFNPSSPQPSAPAPHHSVLIFSLDAVSRLNFIREMPLLHRYLRDRGAIDFIGYHKVGDNTFPNLIPLLTGLSEDELKDNCWPNTTSFFDACPFIWKKYRTQGFTTAFIEDEPVISGFNYLKKGFETQPTDYYLRPFYLEAERAFGHSADISSNTKLCMGQDLNVKFLLKTIAQFLGAVRHPAFGFFWETSLTHDYSALPRLGDDIYKEFFQRLDRAGVFRDTFIILLSDHGLRWGSIRNTYQGRIEERMPFLFLVPPPWFKNKFPLAYQNLKRNINKLVTPYDVHATVHDLLDLEQIANYAILQREEVLSTLDPQLHAFSLFTPVSSARSCASARIPADYCACHDAIRHLPNSDPRAHDAASTTVAHINSLLSNNSLCATLHLHRVHNVQVERSLNKMIAAADAMESWSVALETVPGNGLFEATLRRRGKVSFEVVGTVSRTNLYRGQSECIDDYHLRLYCFCI